MIVDRLESMDKYAAQIPNLEHALKFIRGNPNPVPGSYPFEGGYLMLQTGMTSPAGDGLFEAHRSYLDIQVLLEGEEIILWNTLDRMKPEGEYDSNKDKQSLAGDGSMVEMRPGMCCILYPEDVHKGCRHVDHPMSYTKYVVKLRIV